MACFINRQRTASYLIACLVPLAGLFGGIASAEESSTALQLFEDRIMPIFKSPNPSSCVQCHLSSVDIKDYILPSHRDTFLALREDGLIDVASPDKSKILTLIRMGDQDADKLAKRIHEKTRKAEFEAFSAWIHACCDDSSLLLESAPASSNSVGPKKPIEVIRHARKSRVVESFTRNVWSQRMRCFPCHTPAEIDKDNPKHQKPAKTHREFVQKYGAKMNLFRETPEATLAALVVNSRKQHGERYPLINLEEPSKSLLVLKPTAKLPPKKPDGTFPDPSASEPVSHMGGLKMHVNDHSYKLIVSWVEDYAAVVGDRYATPDQLPADNWIATNRILRVKATPSHWKVGSVVQLFVFEKTGDNATGADRPVAFTQGTVTPRGMVNGAVMLIQSNLGDRNREAGDPEPRDGANPDLDTGAPFPLEPGKYLIKAYLDNESKVSQSPSLLLGQEAFVGQTTIDAKWMMGFPNAETLAGESFER